MAWCTRLFDNTPSGYGSDFPTLHTQLFCIECNFETAYGNLTELHILGAEFCCVALRTAGCSWVGPAWPSGDHCRLFQGRAPSVGDSVPPAGEVSEDCTGSLEFRSIRPLLLVGMQTAPGHALVWGPARPHSLWFCPGLGRCACTGQTTAEQRCKGTLCSLHKFPCVTFPLVICPANVALLALMNSSFRFLCSVRLLGWVWSPPCTTPRNSV